MTLQLKLSQKAVLVVALPLLIQGGFYVVLKHQLAESRLQTQQIELSKQIVSQLNEYIMEMARVFEELSTFSQSAKPSSKMDRLQLATRARAVRLCALLRSAGHAVEAQSVEDLSGRFAKELEVAKQTGAAPFSDMAAAERFMANFRFRASATRLSNELNRFALKEQTVVAAAGAHERSARQSLGRALDIAVFFNSLLTLLIVLYFVRGTVSRLELLKDNARRLAAGQPLSQQVGSDDEVGEVDRTFHEMAQALNAARERETLMIETVRVSERRLASLIDALPVALVVTDELGKIESLNPTAEQLSSYACADLIGDRLDKLLLDKSAERDSRSLVKRLLDETKERPLSLEGVSAYQETIPVEVYVRSFEDGANRRLLATIFDITERYKMERLKRDFVAIVSHDIRTPLSSIMSTLEIARDGRLGEIGASARDLLSDAGDNAARLLRMVESLLNLEKLEAGLTSLNLEKFRIADLLRSAIPPMEASASEYGIAIELKATSLTGIGDRDSLRQVLINLLENAMAFSSVGSKVVLSAADRGSVIEISVRDFGVGVPDEIKDVIFERFKQVHERRNAAVSRGFGLGLSICQAIVNQHGQSIGFESIEGGGTRFWFTVASALSDEEASSSNQGAPPSAEKFGDDRGGAA